MDTFYHSTQFPSVPGVYCITCISNKRIYIGSAVNLHRRWQEHCRRLQRNEHRNPKLQNAFNKYGEAAFLFEILELVLLPELLTAREQYWFSKLRPFGKKGFNLAPTAGSRLGMENTPEHREKIGQAHRGKKATPETLERLRISHLGNPGYWTGKKRPPETITKLSDEARAKISAANLGRPKSPETREKLRLANLGKTQSEETRRKEGDAHRGKPRSPETKEKISLAKLGKPHSAEARSRMIVAHASSRKTIIVTSPDGVEYSVVGIRQFCKEHNLDRSTLMRIAKGQYSNHKGWRARFPETDAS